MLSLATRVQAAANTLGFNGTLYRDGVGTDHTAWHTYVKLGQIQFLLSNHQFVPRPSYIQQD